MLSLPGKPPASFLSGFMDKARKVIAQYPQPTALALQEVVAKQGPDAIHKFMNGDRQLIEQVHQSLHHYERDSDSERGQDVLANIERATKDT